MLMHSDRTSTLIQSIEQEAASNDDIQFFYQINDMDPQQQILDVKAMMKNGIDILVIAPVNDPSVVDFLEEVHQKGVQIIFLEGGGNAPIKHYETKVIVDNYEVGKYIARYLKTKYEGKRADGLVIRGSATEFDNPRYDGFVYEMGQADADISISCVINSSNDRLSAQKMMDEYLNFRGIEQNHDYRQFSGEKAPIGDFIYAFNCQIAAGVKDSFVSHNFRNFPFIIGVSDINESECLTMVENHYIDAAVIYTSIGEKVYGVIEDLINHNPVDSIVTPPIFILDKDNISLYREQTARLGNKNIAVNLMADQIVNDKISLREQKVFIVLILFLLAVSGLLLVYVARQNRDKQQLLTHSEEQNAQIKQQIEELQEQKAQLVELSKKLEESTQAKLVFFTNISHEFKTPLSLISGPITDLVNRQEFSPEVHSLLDIIYRNSSRLNRLITELIDFRIYESENIVINYSIGNVKDFLMNIALLFEDAIIRRNITYDFDAPEGIDYNIPFDPIKLEKVFTNLMSNAFNHVKDNGKISVSLRIDKNDNSERNLHLSVFNTDSYIPEEMRKTIFRRFYTMDNSRGTGIGLALTTAIVDAFNGSISVKSDKNTGTEFSVDIPVSDYLVTDAKFNNSLYEPDFAKLKLATIDIQEQEFDIVTELSSSEKPIALIVEDNKDMRIYLRTILNNEYRIIPARNGNEGYERAIKYRPGIVVSDIFMPEKDGFQLCLDIRANDITRNIPILLLTASSSDEQRAKGYECGADAYLEKPFNDQTLKIRMRKLLEKHQHVQEQIDFGFLPNISRSGLNESSIKFLDKFRKYVENHIDEEISVDDIAEHFSYSKSKLYRELKEVTDYSPIDMVNLIRLKYAIDLMLNQNKNITETAFMCGFTSASYFSRVFQKYYNERPLSYVKRLTKINKNEKD